jgi:hypothetical protein
MEPAGIRRLAENWMNPALFYPRVKRFVHDKDRHGRAIVRDVGWDLVEFLDPSHARKSIVKHLTRVFHDHPGEVAELRGPSANWLNNIIDDPRLDGLWQEKRRRWLNAAAHFSGHHEHCDHARQTGGPHWSGATDPGLQGRLQTFLQDTLETLSRVDRRYTTNFNESLNSTKAKFAPKQYAFPVSFSIRCCAAVLSRNDPKTWYRKLRPRLALQELPSLFRQVLAQTTDKRDRDAAHRDTPEGRRKITEQRKQYRRFIYGSSRDTEQGREHIGVDEDAIECERTKAQDEKFNIFVFATAPRTAMIENVPRDADPEKLYGRLARAADIVWAQAEEAMYRGKEKLRILVVTSSEMQADRIVASTLNHRFHKGLMKSSGPRFIGTIYERSVLISHIPSFLSPPLLYERLGRAGKICDFRVAEGAHGRVALCWFADRESARQTLTDRFRSTLGTTQITLAESGEVTSQFMLDHLTDDRNIADGEDDSGEEDGEEGIDEEVFTQPPDEVFIQGDAVPDSLSPETIESLFSSANPGKADKNPRTLAFGVLADPPYELRFPNIGGTCWLAACIQLLFHIPWPGGFCGMFGARQYEIFNSIHAVHELRRTPCTDMDRVVHCFRRLHEWLHVEKLDRQAQQDPQEVLHYIFDQLCSICPRAEGMITGRIRQVTERREPRSVAEMDLPFTMPHLIVPSGEETDLESLIQLSEMPRDFHDDHEDGCITATAVRLPPILIFALDRLQWVFGVQQNVQTCVNLPTGLSSNVFTRIGEGHTFQLSGIIAHQGPGHGGRFSALM